MAIYANEDGTVTSLTDEYLAAGSGLTGVRTFSASSSTGSLNTTVDFPSAPKFCMCFYRYVEPTSSGRTSDGVDRLNIDTSSGSSGNFVSIGNGKSYIYRYTYYYNDSTKKLSVKISNGYDSSAYGNSSYSYEDGILIIFY